MTESDDTSTRFFSCTYTFLANTIAITERVRFTLHTSGTGHGVKMWTIARSRRTKTTTQYLACRPKTLNRAINDLYLPSYFKLFIFLKTCSNYLFLVLLMVHRSVGSRYVCNQVEQICRSDLTWAELFISLYHLSWKERPHTTVSCLFRASSQTWMALFRCARRLEDFPWDSLPCQEPLALMFQAYQQDWAESEDEKNEAKYQELLIQLSSFLQGGAPAELLQPDLFLCTRPFLFCWLLRDLWPVGLPQVPMLHYYSGPLLFDTTEAQKLRVLQVFQQTVLTSTLDLVVSGLKTRRSETI